MSADDLLKRIMQLKQFEVEMDIPEDFQLSGRVPFDMLIKEDRVVATVLALDYEEARDKLYEYLHK